MHGDAAGHTADQRLAGRFLAAEADAAAPPDRPARGVGEGEKRGKQLGVRLQRCAQSAKQRPPVLPHTVVRRQLVAELRLHGTEKPGKPR